MGRKCGYDKMIKDETCLNLCSLLPLQEFVIVLLYKCTFLGRVSEKARRLCLEMIRFDWCSFQPDKVTDFRVAPIGETGRESTSCAAQPKGIGLPDRHLARLSAYLQLEGIGLISLVVSLTCSFGLL